MKQGGEGEINNIGRRSKRNKRDKFTSSGVKPVWCRGKVGTDGREAIEKIYFW